MARSNGCGQRWKTSSRKAHGGMHDNEEEQRQHHEPDSTINAADSTVDSTVDSTASTERPIDQIEQVTGVLPADLSVIVCPNYSENPSEQSSDQPSE
jgi:hypothetical protein